MRRPLMAGNWKMFKTPLETRAFFETFKPLVADSRHADVVIAPPFTALETAVASAQGTAIAIGAQDVFWEKQGAFTGEVSPLMLRSLGCRYVIIGHSERRQYFHETDDTVRRKTAAALEAALLPIVCVGETLDERESEATERVLTRQFSDGLGSLTLEQFARIIIAYEPVWAIGTGRTATPELAAAAHRLLRQLTADRFGRRAADALRILYGGSVKPDNVKGLMTQTDIDGALVGGASLEPASFASIVNF